MSSPSPTVPPEQTGKAPGGELPPLQPPSVGFILQLFVIPMVIVTIIVVIWLLFNWLAHMGTNPRELVRDLKKLNEDSWQKALTLADLLRNPQHKNLKKDDALAREVAALLDEEIKAGRMDAGPIQLRVFLCRALGEFQVESALPSLLQAAMTQRQAVELQVRRAALQALAVYIDSNNPAQLRENTELESVLMKASRERADTDPENSLAELRSTAAFTLGILGGDQAHERLLIMLEDGYPNSRYNAAIALCRHGDVRATPVLLEMLDPDNDESVLHETRDDGKPWKRLLVMQNGIRATTQLAQRNRTDDLGPLVQALERVKQSDLAKFDAKTRRGVHIEAGEAVFRLRERSEKSGSAPER